MTIDDMIRDEKLQYEKYKYILQMKKYHPLIKEEW